MHFSSLYVSKPVGDAQDTLAMCHWGGQIRILRTHQCFFFSGDIYSFSQGCSHEICSFPLGFSWNCSNEAYIPTFAIPTIFPLYSHCIHKNPSFSSQKKKRFPGGRAFGSFGADVSRASRVALEGSRCMDGSVANMYVAKGYAEGSRTGPFRRHFPWEIHQWGIRITWVN